MASRTKVEVSFLKLLNYADAVQLVKPDPRSAPQTKLEYAVDRNRTVVADAVQKYMKKRADIQLKYAMEDSEGKLKLDDKGNYVFKKESIKSMDAENESLKNDVVELEVYHATAVPGNISPYLIEAMQPISIDPDMQLFDDTNLPVDLPERRPQGKVIQAPMG